MIFILGIICGILLAFMVFLGYVYLSLKGKNPIARAIQKIEDKAKPRAIIFEAPNEEEAAQQEIMDRNEKEGKNTSAEELGI